MPGHFFKITAEIEWGGGGGGEGLRREKARRGVLIRVRALIKAWVLI